MNSEKFWDYFEIVPVTPDGHCLLYSIATYFNALHAQNFTLTAQYLANIIRCEVESKIELYRVGIDNMSVTELLSEMNDYIVNKNYKSSFCDMVPMIVTNALKISIVILEKYSGNIRVSHIAPRQYDDCPAYIVVCKDFSILEHYDAIVPMACADVSNNDNGNVVISEFGKVSTFDRNDTSIQNKNENISDTVYDDAIGGLNTYV